MSAIHHQKLNLTAWRTSGGPWIWMSAASLAISVMAVCGIIGLIAYNGFAHFWPNDIERFTYHDTNGHTKRIFAERVYDVDITTSQFLESGAPVQWAGEGDFTKRWLIKTGNRRINPPDFRWLYDKQLVTTDTPSDVLIIERSEWGNVYGTFEHLARGTKHEHQGEHDLAQLYASVERATALRRQIEDVERRQIGPINRRLERLRLQLSNLQRSDEQYVAKAAAMEIELQKLQAEYGVQDKRMQALRSQIAQDTVTLRDADGRKFIISVEKILHVWQPNTMHLGQKVAHFLGGIWRFVSDDPREANTEGGVFPALFGTVLMVLIMSLMVTPLGVVAAIYLSEYAQQGPLVRMIRVAVNNLAGVPSIVYGVFGLGFFVYFVGGGIDQLFFSNTLPAPTFGTPGLIWASLTLALLTLPVVIVSTEEGLQRIPRSQREGSLALGATKAETLFNVIIPMASPAILTGVILAVARAAGEVAPLMLVGVVKLAPSLPLDGEFPYLHLDRKFMHLGFHIYDVGFQSPNIEAARPLVYATALLLITLIIGLNLTAIALRNRLEQRFRGVDL